MLVDNKNIIQVLTNVGSETARNIGVELGRLVAKPSTKELSPEIKQVKNSLVNGLVNGYFRRENGNLNWSILFIPIAIILLFIFIIRKI
jgi:hypothetical protein